MELKDKTVEELMERRSAIAAELDAPEADLDALEAEVRAINEELESRKAEETRRAEVRKAVAAGEGETIKSFESEERKGMTLEEIRKSAAYVDAYARYIKTGRDDECRMLLTEGAYTSTESGPVPVPALVEEIVHTAWDREEIMQRVRKTFIRGNLKATFERSADPAYVHTEGTSAPTEEDLELGIVTMIPANIKKWIYITDEARAMGGEAFLRYVYDELTYQIAKKEAALGVLDIAGAGTSHTASAVGIPKANLAPGTVTLKKAATQLGDVATDLVVIMNRLSEGEFLDAEVAGNFSKDPFEGFTKLYSSALPAYATADDNAVYAIVGDLRGLQFNYPEGDGVVIVTDNLTKAEEDLVKIVARKYAAHAVVAPGCFVNITKPAAATT
jgi:HK97 family phage major capsid protein